MSEGHQNFEERKDHIASLENRSRNNQGINAKLLRKSDEKFCCYSVSNIHTVLLTMSYHKFFFLNGYILWSKFGTLSKEEMKMIKAIYFDDIQQKC